MKRFLPIALLWLGLTGQSPCGLADPFAVFAGCATLMTALSGLGGESEHEEHLRFAWCESALGRDSRYFLGVDYELGRGVRPDLRKAVFWYGVAGKEGDEYAQNLSDKLAEKLIPVERAEARRQIADWKPDPSLCNQVPGSTKHVRAPSKRMDDDAPVPPAATINP